MAKGGGFSGGGGFKGGGFSGGNRPNGTNFSSFRPKSGARPPVNGNSNMHGGNNSFLWGAVIGSILNGNSRRTTNTNRSNAELHPIYNDSYVANAPMQPTPASEKPKYREYKYCEYCQSEFTDLTLTKCPNCGAKLTHTTAPIGKKPDSNSYSSYSSSSSTAQTGAKPKKNGFAVAVCIVIAAIILIGIVAAFSNGGTGILDNSIVTFVQPIDASKTTYFNVGETASSTYLKFKVLNYVVTDEIQDLSTDDDGYTYVLVRAQITNAYAGELPIYIRDFSLVYNGKNYQALPINQDGYFGFNNGSGIQRRFDMEVYSQMTNYFVFRLESYNDGALAFEYNEYEDTDDLLGTYIVNLK